jgi:signal transduction histidine kinase
MLGRFGAHGRGRWLLAGGVGAYGLVVLASMIVSHRARLAEVGGFGEAMHRVVSQRVDQHDALLTSLSALVQATDPPPIEAIEPVVQSIIRFYPRIVAIDIVELGPAPATLRTGSPPLSAAKIEAARASGQAMALAPLAGERLLLIAKRAPATESGRFATVLTIDLARLTQTDAAGPEDALIALHHEGARIHGGPEAGAGTVVFDRPLSSRTQPLRLQIVSASTLWPQPPLSLLAGAALLIAIVLWLADKVAEARLQTREARARAASSARDARLAHAGRINAMGEMASGIAHEVTQPLTAILSHAQAGQRLAARPALDQGAILGAFEAIARNARRAGDIVGKLRSWISRSEVSLTHVDLCDVARDVVALIRTNGLPPGASIDVDVGNGPVAIMADRVQIEQVAYNLLSNALDAVASRAGAGRVLIAVRAKGDEAVLSVEDDGPGLPPPVRERLFEPFFTTKDNGMGLGLALCMTLVERFGGTIEAGEAALGGAAFTARFPRAAWPALQDAA